MALNKDALWWICVSCASTSHRRDDSTYFLRLRYSGGAMRQRGETTTRGAFSSFSLRALLRACGIQPQTFFPFGVLCAPLYGLSCSLRSEPPAEKTLPYGSVALVGLLSLWLLWCVSSGRDPCPGDRVTGFTDMCSNSSPNALWRRPAKTT